MLNREFEQQQSYYNSKQQHFQQQQKHIYQQQMWKRQFQHVNLILQHQLKQPSKQQTSTQHHHETPRNPFSQPSYLIHPPSLPSFFHNSSFPSQLPQPKTQLTLPTPPIHLPTPPIHLPPPSIHPPISSIHSTILSIPPPTPTKLFKSFTIDNILNA